MRIDPLRDDVSLRDWRLEDADAVLAVAQSPEMPWQIGRIETNAQATAYVEKRLVGERADLRSFAIVLDGVCVGEVAASSIDLNDRLAWISYWVAPEARGRGLASLATQSLAAWMFAMTPVFRLELGHRVNNPASGKVAERAGFIAEGHERSKLEYDGDRYDTISYSRLRIDPEPPGLFLPIKTEQTRLLLP